jgi:hypothetical protein
MTIACHPTHAAARAGRKSRTTLEAVYIEVPRSSGGKSCALELQGRVTRALQAQGFPLKSDYDKRTAKQ